MIKCSINIEITNTSFTSKSQLPKSSMFKTTLSPEQLTQFSDIHTSFIPKRKKRFETYDILYPTSRAADKNKEVYTRINPILEKSLSILQSNNITDFDERIYSVEFHQRNCGFEFFNILCPLL